MTRGSSVIVVALLAALVQGVFLFESACNDPSFSLPIVDAGVYHQTAIDLSAGRGFPDTAFWQPPGWPLLLGAVYWIAGPSVWAAKVFLAMLALGSVVLLARLAHICFGPRVGLTAGVMLALYGPFVFFATQLLPVGPAIFWMLSALNVAAMAVQRQLEGRGGWWLWLSAGLMTGVATITVPHAGVIALPLIVLLLRGLRAAHEPSRVRWPSRIGGSAAYVCGIALLILPIAWRNHSVSGEWVLISSNGGINFYAGNNAESDKTIALRPGEPWKRLTLEPLTDGVTTGPAQSRWFFERSFAFMREHPGAFLAGLLRKTHRMLRAVEMPRNADPYCHREDSWLLSVLLLRVGVFGFPWSIMLPLVIWGMFRRTRPASASSDDPPDAKRVAGALMRSTLIWSALLYATLVILFFVTARYRLPIAVLLLPFAGYGLQDVVCLLQRGRHATTPPERNAAGGWKVGLACVVLVLLLAHWPLRIPTDGINFRAERLRSAAGQALDRGDIPTAMKLVDEALKEDPQYAAAHALRGQTLLISMGDDTAGRQHADVLAKAEASLNTAIDLNPYLVYPRKVLAAAFVEQQRYDEAIEQLRLALQEEPLDQDARRSLQQVLYRRSQAAVVDGDFAQAIANLEEAIALAPPAADAKLLNQLAWLYVTCPRSALMNPARAAELAERACSLTGYEHPVMLDTLAAAYAASGRWGEAIRWASRAEGLARAGLDLELAQDIAGRIEQYKAAASAADDGAP